MNVLRVDSRAPEAALLARAAEVLRRGGLVAFPTETVYGLGAHALDPAAVAEIYRAKGRPSYNPLIVHVSDADAARALSSAWPEAADRLAAAFWPGPLTLVVPRAAAVPVDVTAGLPNVALRVPAHPVALALLRAAALPVAAPSANRSTEISPTTAEHVARSLGDRVDLILDGGPCEVGIESTVLSLASGVPTILRPGTISVDEIAELIGGEVASVQGKAEREGAALPSPGMMDRHYAPRAELIVAPDPRGVELDGRRTAVLTLHGPIGLPGASALPMPPDPAGYAARLYATLHALDGDGYERIVAEEPPDTPAWAGVRDRLRRAATPR